MKLELIIPTSLNEIPLKHYQEFRKVVEGSNDEMFISEKMVQLFCGIELKDVVKIKASDLTDLVQHFNKLFEEKQGFINRFTLGGVEFGFIPDLENISWGEYIDLESNLSSWDTMHKAMAVMYRPIIKTKKEKYEIEEYISSATYAEVMKFAPVNIALGASLFFWTLGSELLTALADYLEKEVKKMVSTTTQSELSLVSNGDGISQSMQSLKETLQNLTQLQKNHLQNV